MTVRQSRKLLPGGTMVMGATKAHSDRVFKMPLVVLDALKAHKTQQAEERLAAPAWEDHGLVFCNSIGRPLDPSNLRRDLTQRCEEAGVERICPYELRHSTASLLVDKGLPLEEVSDLLGHKDVRMLAQVYRHRTKRVVDLTDAQDRMLREG
jgi:site-specific recombinase XerD